MSGDARSGDATGGNAMAGGNNGGGNGEEGGGNNGGSQHTPDVTTRSAQGDEDCGELLFKSPRMPTFRNVCR